jgi:hypothetical protein
MIICPKCQNPHEQETRFCVACGWRLPSSPTPPPPAPVASPPPAPVASPPPASVASPPPASTGTTVRRDRAGAEYVWVPAGAGLAGFWMLRTPVTNAMWRAAVRAGAVQPPGSTAAYDDAAKTQHPVVWVTREQARAYATWVGGRLPRDAEWTRAAQGDDGRRYPWGEQPPDATRANFNVPRSDARTTTPVGSYPAGASPYGLLDMAGNVWEWVDDGDFVVRGGAFGSLAGYVVCGARYEIGAAYDSPTSWAFELSPPGPDALASGGRRRRRARALVSGTGHGVRGIGRGAGQRGGVVQGRGAEAAGGAGGRRAPGGVVGAAWVALQAGRRRRRARALVSGTGHGVRGGGPGAPGPHRGGGPAARRRWRRAQAVALRDDAHTPRCAPLRHLRRSMHGCGTLLAVLGARVRSMLHAAPSDGPMASEHVRQPCCHGAVNHIRIGHCDTCSTCGSERSA